MLDLVRGIGIEGADVDLRGVHAREDEGGDAGLVLSEVVEVVLDVERVAGDVVEGLDGDGERVVVDRVRGDGVGGKMIEGGLSWGLMKRKIVGWDVVVEGAGVGGNHLCRASEDAG